MDHIFTDAAGRVWSVIDYKIFNGKTKRGALGSWTDDGRAFVPSGWDGPVMLHRFGLTPYHDIAPRTLQGQLNPAKPSTAPPAERMQRNVEQ